MPDSTVFPVLPASEGLQNVTVNKETAVGTYHLKKRRKKLQKTSSITYEESSFLPSKNVKISNKK